MINDPCWLTTDEVIAMNEVLVRATGEAHMVRDLGALEGALSRPNNRYQYEGTIEVHTLAGYLILAVGKAHAFEQGNKRTAWAAGRLFIHNNGYLLDLSNVSQLIAARMVENAVKDEERVHMLIEFLRKRIKPA